MAYSYFFYNLLNFYINLLRELLTVETCTENAWDNLLKICVSCPSACVSNKDDYCPMFDDDAYKNN